LGGLKKGKKEDRLPKIRKIKGYGNKKAAKKRLISLKERRARLNLIKRFKLITAP
jgi:hypothetical protein